MREISKGHSDEVLEKRRLKSIPHTGPEAAKAWSSFGPRKKGTKNRCFKEQYGLCGYSEVEIEGCRVPIFDNTNVDISKPLGSHLEHVVPKSLCPSATFDHNNLILSAISSDDLQNLSKQDVFGGHYKRSRHSKYFLSPLVPDCRKYFHFEVSTGKVVPKLDLPKREQAKARLTIYLLNLNAPILRHWRMTWLNQLQKVFNSMSTIDEMKHFAEVELSPIHGMLRPFHSAQRQFFGKLGESVCKSQGVL